MSRLTEEVHKFFSAEVVLKLAQKRIATVTAFMDSDSEFLTKTSGLQFRQVLAIKDGILAKFSSKIRTADSYYKEILHDGAIVPTGIKKLDDLLEGGLYTGFMYEVCGVSSCGKSQICMTAAANISAACQQPVLYIDTKGDLSADRLVSNLEGKFEEVGEAIGRIRVTKPKDAYDVVSSLHAYIDNAAAERRVRLVVIDSLASLFYQFIGDRQESASLLSTISSLLQYIAVELYTAVLVTNLSTTWQGDDAEDVQRVGLGKFWEHVPCTRMVLSRLSGPDILVTVTKSSSLAIGCSVTLAITESGVK